MMALDAQHIKDRQKQDAEIAELERQIKLYQDRPRNSSSVIMDWIIIDAIECRLENLLGFGK